MSMQTHTITIIAEHGLNLRQSGFPVRLDLGHWQSAKYMVGEVLRVSRGLREGETTFVLRTDGKRTFAESIEGDLTLVPGQDVLLRMEETWKSNSWLSAMLRGRRVTLDRVEITHIFYGTEEAVEGLRMESRRSFSMPKILAEEPLEREDSNQQFS